MTGFIKSILYSFMPAGSENIILHFSITIKHALMKSLFLVLLFPVFAFGQRQESFGKFNLPDGANIRGTSTVRGYERQLEVSNLIGTPAGNNTTIRLQIPTCDAVGSFRNLLNTKQRLRNGEIAVTVPGEKRKLDYRIVMQDITVEECVDAEGQTTLQLKAGRIGWIYYTTDRRGKSAILSKAGWDEAKNDVWTEF